MDPLDYLKVLRRRWRVLASCLLVALLAAWFTTPADTPQATVPAGTSYRATHTLLQAADATAPVNLELTRLFATTGDIPRRAAVRLGEPAESGPLLAAQVVVTVQPEVGSLTVSSSGSDGPRAAAIANAFGVEIVDNLRRTLQKDRDAGKAEANRLVEDLGDRIAQLTAQAERDPANADVLKAQRSALLENYSTAFARLQALSADGAARSPLMTLEQAVPVPVVASSVFTPPSSRNGRLLVAGLAGLVLGVLLALVLERVDRRLRSREAVEDITSLPVVAEVPVLPRPARRDWSISVVAAPAGAVAEAYRSLRSAVMLVPSRPALASGPDLEWRSPQVLLVTSPLPADGKTTTVANLAACLAESGRQVLVLDGDFRNPSLHRFLRVPQGRGMSDLLAGTSSAELQHVVRASTVPGVRLVTSGTVTDHPAALLARAGSLVDEARRLADVVLIDAAPVLSANDATDLLPYVDAVVLVTRSGRTTRDQAVRTAELLARLSVPIAGTVLIGGSGSIGHYAQGPRGLLSRLGLRRRGSAAEPPRDWLTGAAETAAPSASDERGGRRRRRGGGTSGNEAGSRAWTRAPRGADRPVGAEAGTGWPAVGDGLSTRRTTSGLDALLAERPAQAPTPAGDVVSPAGADSGATPALVRQDAGASLPPLPAAPAAEAPAVTAPGDAHAAGAPERDQTADDAPAVAPRDADPVALPSQPVRGLRSALARAEAEQPLPSVPTPGDAAAGRPEHPLHGPALAERDGPGAPLSRDDRDDATTEER